MKQELTEVKMSMIRKRSEFDNQKTTYQCTDCVTVLAARQEEEDRWIRQETVVIGVFLTRSSETRRTRKMMRLLQAKERSDRSHWGVTEDDWETTEGEDVDVLGILLLTTRSKGRSYLDCCHKLIKFVQRGLLVRKPS